MKLIAPTLTLQTGGILRDLYWDKTVGRFSLSGLEDGLGNTIIEGDIDLSVSEIVQILTAGGEIKEYLMAFKADKDILNDTVPVGLPNRLDAFGDAKTFKNWFDSTAEIWINASLIADSTKICFYTNPIGTTKQQYLTGNEMLILFNALGVTRNISVVTTSEFINEIGWTKI